MSQINSFKEGVINPQQVIVSGDFDGATAKAPTSPMGDVKQDSALPPASGAPISPSGVKYVDQSRPTENKVAESKSTIGESHLVEISHTSGPKAPASRRVLSHDEKETIAQMVSNSARDANLSLEERKVLTAKSKTGDGQLDGVMEHKLADPREDYVAFCNANNVPKHLRGTRMFERCHDEKMRDIAIRHNTLLGDVRMREAKRNGQKKASKETQRQARVEIKNLARAEEQKDRNQKLVDKKIQEVKQDPEIDIEPEADEKSALDKFFEDAHEAGMTAPNVGALAEGMPQMRAAGRTCRVDVVVPWRDKNGVIVANHQSGLARELIGGYTVVSTVVRRIAQVVRLVLDDPSLQSLALTYASNILEDYKRPQTSDGSGGLLYSGYADIGPQYIEIYAVCAIYVALQARLSMFASSPHIECTPTDWKFLSTIASFVTSAAAISAALPATVAKVLAVPATALIGNHAAVLDNLHKALFPDTSLLGKAKRWFGGEAVRPKHLFHINNNLDYNTFGYETVEFAGMTPENFHLVPIEESKLHASHRQHLGQSQALLEEAASQNLESLGCVTESLNSLGRGFLSLGPLLSSAASTLHAATKTACSAAQRAASFLWEKSQLKQTCNECQNTCNFCIPLLSESSTLIAADCRQQVVRYGSTDSPRTPDLDFDCVSPPSTSIRDDDTSERKFSARERRSRSLDARRSSQPEITCHRFNTWMTGTFAPAMTTLSASLGPTCMLLGLGLRGSGIVTIGSILTCLALRNRSRVGTHDGGAYLEMHSRRNSTAPGWTQRNENLHSRSLLESSRAMESKATLSTRSMPSLQTYQQDPEAEFVCTDGQCSAQESPTPRSPTPL